MPLDPSHLSIKIDKKSNVSHDVVIFDGNLDKLGFDKVREELDTCVESFDKIYLVFDFATLSFINSESIGLLLTIHYRLTKKGKHLVIVNAPDNVKDVLDVIGMFKIIQYFNSVNDFEESLKK